MKQPTPIFQGDIVDKKLKILDRVKKDIARYVSSFANGSKIDIIIKKHSNKRTNDQNAYYWGVVITILSDHFGYDSEEMHEEMKYLFNPIQSKIHPDRKIGGSTTKLSTVDFFSSNEKSYVERICKWAAEDYDIYIPPPERIYL